MDTILGHQMNPRIDQNRPDLQRRIIKVRLQLRNSPRQFGIGVEDIELPLEKSLKPILEFADIRK